MTEFEDNKHKNIEKKQTENLLLFWDRVSTAIWNRVVIQIFV